MKKQIGSRQPEYQNISIQEPSSAKRDPLPKQSPQQVYRTYVDHNNQEVIPQATGNYDLKMAGHPLACIFTFLFKAAAITAYLFFGLLFSDVFVFILVTVLSGIDFWIVKNVTGRLLVGLRWWSEFTEEGKQIWIYESFDREVKLNAVDAAFFWTSQLAATVTWLVFLILKVLSLSFFWGILVLINFVLCITNLYGFYKCRGQHNKKLKDLKSKYATQGLMHFASKMI